ncbi:MAG: hypothetical protein OXF29_07610 [Hyphomicrobiales bacterium]|nr:hypothetical protein [Hyphomicrobiales bacterium]
MSQSGVLGGILRKPVRLRAPSPPLALPRPSSHAPSPALSPALPSVLSFVLLPALLPALALAAVLLAGCAGDGGNRFIGPGDPPPRDSIPVNRAGREELNLAGLEFDNQTDMRLAALSGSELERINAHYAYAWTHSSRELLDATRDISGFGAYIDVDGSIKVGGFIGVGGLGLEHNHGKILGRLFHSALPYPEDAFDVLRIDTEEGDEFNDRELLQSIHTLGGTEVIDEIAESFEVRKKALVRSLTAAYYSDDEAGNGYPDMEDVDGGYIVHINDIRDLTDDGFDDHRRLNYLRGLLEWAEENDLEEPEDLVHPHDPSRPDNPDIPRFIDSTTPDDNEEDNFRYIDSVCADKQDYADAPTVQCGTDRPHFVDFGDGTPEGRDLRLIPDFSQRLAGSQAPGLIANERNLRLRLADLSAEAADVLGEFLELKAVYDIADEREKIARARELLELGEDVNDERVIPRLNRSILSQLDELDGLLEDLGIHITRERDERSLDQDERIAKRIGILLAELRFTPEDGPVHGVAFGSRIVPHLANAALKIECADDANEETSACLAASDIRNSPDGRVEEETDFDKLLAEYIKSIPGPTEEAVDAGAGGAGGVRAVDIFLLDAVIEGNGIATRKSFLNNNLDETLEELEDFFSRRNDPIMVVRSGYGGFEGEPATPDPDGTPVRGPRTFAALPYHYESCRPRNVNVDCRNFRGQLLTAAALNIHNNELHENSPRCAGLPRNWNTETDGRHYCLTAPGDRLRINGKLVTNDDGSNDIDLTAGYRNGSDASPDNYQVDLGAASFVAGSLALLSERFRGQLSGRELALRLVNTANQQIFYDDDTLLTGTPRPTRDEIDDPVMANLVREKTRARRDAVLATYGAGLIDLKAASEAVGGEVVRTSASTSAAGNNPGSVLAPYASTRVTTGAAFGDGLALALRGHEIATFDEWNAPFWRPLSSLVATATSRRSLLERRGDALASGPRLVPLEDGGLLAFSTYEEEGLFSDGRGGERWAERYRDDGLAQEQKIEFSLRRPVDGNLEAELLFAAGGIAELPLGLHAGRDFAHPYLGFAGEGIGAGGSMALGAGRITALGFSGSRGEGGEENYAAHGGLLEYAVTPFPSLKVGMQAGALVEEERALGLHSGGAFGGTGVSSTAFVGVSAEGAAGANWRFRAQAFAGRTNLSAPSAGLVGGFSGIATGAFRLGVEGFGLLHESDEFKLSVSQPLRVESGSVSLVVPVGRTREGALLSERIEGVSLVPGGREIEVSARYEFSPADGLALGFGAGLVHEGGHVRSQATEFYGSGDLSFRF